MNETTGRRREVRRWVGLTILAGLLAFWLLLLSRGYGWFGGRLAAGGVAMEAVAVRSGFLLHAPGSIAGVAEVEGPGGRWARVVPRNIGGGWTLAPFDWAPETDYRVRLGRIETTVRAPQRAAAWLTASLALGQVLLAEASPGETHKPAALALSPDGRYAAVGTSRGLLMAVEAATGRELWRARARGGGVVRAVAFSADGGVLLAGDQGQGAAAWATAVPRSADEGWGRELWRLPFFDALAGGESDAAAPSYALPGVYRIRPLPGGDVLMVAAHSWMVGSHKRCRSKLWRLAARTGEVRWTWPAGDEASRNQVVWFDCDASGDAVAVAVSRDPHAEPADAALPGLPDEAVALLDGAGRVAGVHRLSPLGGLFPTVTFWRGVAMRPDGRFLVVTADDGRAFGFQLGRPMEGGGALAADEPTPPPLTLLWTRNLATPVELAGIPMVATTGCAAGVPAACLVATGAGHVPLDPAAGQRGPPALHPGGLRLAALDWTTGEVRWSLPLEDDPEGIRASDDGRAVAVAFSPVGEIDVSRPAKPDGSHGLLLLGLDERGAPLARLTSTYRTLGPVEYDLLALAADGGAAAVGECEAVAPGQTVVGQTRVHFLR
ncbi:MAG: PQQ-binding-like beta-propeller repeat protein [Planctomycetes bacterium]|nr:PQQ-binding-like beta-propeller repeat protein [Planctomycetota bacterium]